MNLNNIPSGLNNIIDGEETDFIVKSKRNYPKKKAYFLLAFAAFWNSIVSIFVISFIVPILKGEEVHFTANDVPTSGSLENWEPLLLPSLIIGLFMTIGLVIFVISIVYYFQKGAYFVGTPTRFIKFRNGKITVKDWEQFSGNIIVKQKNIVGNLELELRTGKTKSGNNNADKFVPDIMYMVEIDNVFNVEKKCRIRIKENDPTPVINKVSNYD